MEFILVLLIEAEMVGSIRFNDLWSCNEAGGKLVKDLGEAAKYYCFSAGSGGR